MNKYFDIYIENPFKTYNKVKKYFIPLKPKFAWCFGKRNKSKILNINSFDIFWKDKWNSPRHEYNPRIMISLFDYIHLYIDFTLDDRGITDMVYWEAILDFIYYNKNLQNACAAGWSEFNEETQSYEKMTFVILKEPYQTQYINNELTNIYYENTTR